MKVTASRRVIDFTTSDNPSESIISSWEKCGTILLERGKSNVGQNPRCSVGSSFRSEIVDKIRKAMCLLDIFTVEDE